MTLFRWMVALALLPVLAPAADVHKNEGEQQSASQTEGGAGDQEPAGDSEITILPALQQIDAFGVHMKEVFLNSAESKDASTALIVNPFSVRKRGKFYGSLYEYHRNDNFDARNFFDPVGQELPEFKRNQFGISIGAIVTSKFKVFSSYDGLRIVKGSTLLSVVPTPEMKRGDFSAAAGIVDPFTGSAFPDNKIPEERIHAVSARLLSLFPAPNRSGNDVFNYINNQPAINNNDSVSTRVDYEFSPQTKLFANNHYSNGSRTNVSSLPAFGTTIHEKDQDVSIDLSHSFSSNKVLNLNLSFARSASLQLSKQAHQQGLLESLGIEGVGVLDAIDEGYPQFDIMGYAGLGFGGFPGEEFVGGSPENWTQNTYSISTQYTYVHSNHNIAIGGTLDFRHLNNMRTGGTRRGQFGFSGLFTGDAFADFLLGIPYVATRGITGQDATNPKVGSDRSDLRQRPWRLFFKDDWKINRNFTFSMALAYSYSPFFSSTHDNVSLFYPYVFEPPLDGEVVVTGSPRARELGLKLNRGQAAYNDKNDWQPSLGIAYSPLGNNRLVFRASYNITHIPMNPIQGLINVGRNYPSFYLQTASSPTQPILDLSRPFASAIVPSPTFQAADPHLRNAYMQQRAVSLQYEFLRSWSLELTYQGTKTTRFLRNIPANVPLPGSLGEPIQPRRPNSNFGQFNILSSNASLTANELNAQLKRRLTDYFSLDASFLWSRSISDSWGWGFVNPNNPRNLAAERSLYGFSPTKTFNLNYILDLPIGRNKLLSSRWAGKFARALEGWRISGITTFQDGQPFNPEIFGDLNNDGVWGDRPNRIGSGNLPSSKRSPNKWFQTSDFVIPDLSGPNPQWFGDCGRNILLSPGKTNWDISVLKTTNVSDDGKLLEFRVQFFNAFNHVNFLQPDNIINSPTFGVISGADNAREIEVAIKYSF